MSISKHFVGDIAEFGKKAEPAFELLGYLGKHQTKNRLVVVAFGILTFAIDASLGKQIGREERSTPSDNGKHMAHNLIVAVEGNYHIRRLSGRAFNDTEQFLAVKEVVACHVGQLLALVDYDYPYVIHTAKIRKTFEKTKDRCIF